MTERQKVILSRALFNAGIGLGISVVIFLFFAFWKLNINPWQWEAEERGVFSIISCATTLFITAMGVSHADFMDDSNDCND